MKKLINEAKRLQQLAGILKEDAGMQGGGGDYLVVHVGSRGEIDSVTVVDRADGERVATKTYKDFVDSVRTAPNSDQEDIDAWDEYVDEFGSFERYDWGWSLGLGEEDGETFIDMLDPKFLEWEEKIKSKYGENFEWEEIDNRDYYSLMDLFY